MPVAHVNDIDLWYELTAPPEHPGAPLLVLTHGFAGPYWRPIVEDVRARYRVLVYHVRGHGQSTVPEDPAAYSVPQFAADLAALLDALGIDRAHIGGVSMGGMITAQFACDYPGRLRSVLLCDTVCGNGPDEPDGEPHRVEGFVREVFTRQAEIVEKHGLAGLVERENRYRREYDKYADTRSASQEEQDAETALEARPDDVTWVCECRSRAGRAPRPRPTSALGDGAGARLMRRMGPLLPLRGPRRRPAPELAPRHRPPRRARHHHLPAAALEAGRLRFPR